MHWLFTLLHDCQSASASFRLRQDCGSQAGASFQEIRRVPNSGSTFLVYLPWFAHAANQSVYRCILLHLAFQLMELVNQNREIKVEYHPLQRFEGIHTET